MNTHNLENSFNPKISETVPVEEMLSDLIPGFLKNKTDDLHFINEMIEKKDYKQIKKIGHNWKGACPSYGFNYLGEVGKQFEILVDEERYDELKSLVDTLPTYLDNVKVEFNREH